MTKMDEATFICLDCESTGLDPKNDKIIEVAAVRFSLKEQFDQFEALVDPQCLIPKASMDIHHITDQMVAGKPTIREILPALLKFIGKDIIVGHGIEFDITLIASAAERCGMEQKITNNRFLDTLRMARMYGDSPVNSLERLRQHFNIEPEGAHRAMNDVIVNMEVFKQLSRRYRTTHELFEMLSKPILMKTMPLGKHKGRLMRDVPLQYLLWAAHKDFDQDLLYSIRSEIKKRKKGNNFQQSASPFENL